MFSTRAEALAAITRLLEGEPESPPSFSNDGVAELVYRNEHLKISITITTNDLTPDGLLCAVEFQIELVSVMAIDRRGRFEGWAVTMMTNGEVHIMPLLQHNFYLRTTFRDISTKGVFEAIYALEDE